MSVVQAARRLEGVREVGSRMGPAGGKSRAVSGAGPNRLLLLPREQDYRGRKILIVDDDAANIAAIREGLAGMAYDFIEAHDGETALACVRDHLPDLVISDVEMPKMGGIELCRILKANPRFSFIPLILMTARTDSALKIAGLEQGADDYLFKPVDVLELGARVRSMLRIKVLQDEILSANERLLQINEKLQELSMTDPLTGIYNRLYFNKRFRYEYERASRYNVPLTCIMIDIDHFKSVNDRYGHQVGDEVLKAVSQTLLSGLRKVDILARYGGEEIVALLPETPCEKGAHVAERLRRSVEDLAVPRDGGEALRVTISLGVAAHPEPRAESDEVLLRWADDALYRAKRGGRNRVEVHVP